MAKFVGKGCGNSPPPKVSLPLFRTLDYTAQSNYSDKIIRVKSGPRAKLLRLNSHPPSQERLLLSLTRWLDKKDISFGSNGSAQTRQLSALIPEKKISTLEGLNYAVPLELPVFCGHKSKVDLADIEFATSFAEQLQGKASLTMLRWRYSLLIREKCAKI